MKPATERQIALMRSLGINFDPQITIMEASALITEALEDCDSRHPFDQEL